MKTYCVATAIIQDGNKYFIAKRATSKKIAPGLWEFVTGFVEDHEAAEDTILRELAEEVSASGIIIEALEVVQMNTATERWIILPFIVQVQNTDITTTPQEHSMGKWLTWDELEQMPPSECRYDFSQIRTTLELKQYA